MNKVMVERELLERAAAHLEWDGSGPMTTIQFAQKCDALADELRSSIAQPAEVEGAIQCPASQPAECYAAGTQVVHASLVHGIVRKADELQSALSAVTAERDRLRGELDALTWEIASPNISYALRDQLLGQLAGDHDPDEMLCVEDFYSWLQKTIDNIRAERRKAEGSQPVRVFASAAMAAKEA